MIRTRAEFFSSACLYSSCQSYSSAISKKGCHLLSPSTNAFSSPNGICSFLNAKETLSLCCAGSISFGTSSQNSLPFLNEIRSFTVLSHGYTACPNPWSRECSLTHKLSNAFKISGSTDWSAPAICIGSSITIHSCGDIGYEQNIFTSITYFIEIYFILLLIFANTAPLFGQECPRSQ